MNSVSTNMNWIRPAHLMVHIKIWKSINQIEGSNWQDQLFGRTGNQQQYNISVSGGTKSTKFNISYARTMKRVSCEVLEYSKNNN